MSTDLREREVAPVEQVDPVVADDVPVVAVDVAEARPAPLPVFRICLAGALSALAPAWLVGGFFRGYEARAIAFAAVLVGAAITYVSVRFGRPWLQYLLLPTGLVIGAVLIAPYANAGTGSLPGLVSDALRTGGILQPPIDFEPGWRLILSVLFVMLGGGAGALGVALEKPRAAAALPAPVALGAAIVQPPGAEVVSALVAAGLVVAALAVSYGADLTRSSELSGSFERVRLLRSAALGAGLVVAILVLNQFGFLFPNATRDHVDPPTRPQLPPPVPDVPLFEVKMAQKVPLRLGVIDVYQDGAFLLPPNDTGRLDRLNPPAALAAPSSELPLAKEPKKTFSIDVTVKQATGHLLPAVAWATSIEGSATFDHDPRTNTVRLAGRPLFSGLHYSLIAGVPPDGRALARSGAPHARAKEFLEAPPAPVQVKAILGKAPESRFDRLQFVRKALYDHVVAAGVGRPTDVSAARVVKMLDGAEANAYEITAAEALLARWAGIPSRIGYGYYGGTAKRGGVVEIRPKNGSTWLEAYFTGYGWQPIVGVPPRAKPSLSRTQKNTDVKIEAIDQFGLVVYLPARADSLTPLFVYVRYYLARALPIAMGVAFLLIAYPGFVKALRRRRRRAWAGALGPRERIGVAYAEFRDRARDLAIGDPLATPLEFCDEIEPDEEHDELAWLVTRSLWGDYRSDIAADLASEAEDMAASVTRRLTGAQSWTTRALAFVTRTSLRDPYTREVPNLWWTRRTSPIAALRRVRLRLRLRSAAATTLLLLLVGLFTSCGSSAPPAPARPLPIRLAPAKLGGFVLNEEPKAAERYAKGARDPDVIVDGGRVFTLRSRLAVVGAVQFARFKPGYRADDARVTDAIRSTIGGFRRLRGHHAQPIWVSVTPDQRIYLWFPSDADAMALLVVRNALDVSTGESLADALVTYGRGEPLPKIPGATA
jgi:hypothetical protein